MCVKNYHDCYIGRISTYPSLIFVNGINQDHG